MNLHRPALVLFVAWVGLSFAQFPATSANGAENRSAQDLYETARARRAVWRDFPGFTADLVISEGEVTYRGKIKVASNFEYTLEVPEAAKQKWVDSKLRSLISHREPGEDVAPEVAFADEQASHLLGRLVAFKDGSGMLRIHEGRIVEVIRKSEDMWFEITTLQTLDTNGGDYLPAITSVAYRDPKTGDLRSNRTNRFTWKEVGRFHLPTGLTTVDVGVDGERTVRELKLDKHQLSKAEAPTSDDPKSETRSEASQLTVADAVLHRPLEEPLTSFGAAVLGEYLYVFSGHDGNAHGFGKDVLADHFRRIKFDDPKAQWEELAKHEPAQSAALVTDGEYLYRIGGLTFLNESDEETNFKSTQHFSRYDITKNKWEELAPLPEPRSSLDAAVMGRSVYVAGGWNLQGESSGDAKWHDKILRFDLDNPKAGWQSLPGPDYLTRAASVAAHNGKLYLLGGIQERGITRNVSVFDPKTEKWSAGPELAADSRTSGFATSSFACGDSLYQTGASGIVYRLNDEGTQWELETRLMFPRMFLRLLPAGDDRLLALGGTSLAGGRMAVVESIQVGETNVTSRAARWSVKFDGRAKHSQTVALNGTQLYVFGGNASRSPHDFSAEAFVDEAFVFDIPQQTVEKLPAVPQAMQSGAAVVLNQTSEHKSIALFGGLGIDSTDTFGSLDSAYTFNTDAKTWSTSEAKLPVPRSMFRAATYDDAAWLFGGSDAGKDGKGLQASVLHWWGDEGDIRAIPESKMPTARRSFGGAQLGEQYFVVGGLTEDSGLAETVDVFSFVDRSWKQVASPKVARVFPSLVASGDKLYLFGGFTQADGHFAPATSLEVYDPKQDQWSVLADALPGVDPSMQMLDFHGRLLFYGIDKQQDGLANFVLLDPESQAEPKSVETLSFSPRDDANAATQAKILMRKDENLDGKLSREELGSRLLSLLEDGDTDGDNAVSYRELKELLDRREKAKKEDSAGESNSDTATK